MLASTVQFSSYGQNQPPCDTTTHQPGRGMTAGQSQTYDNHTNNHSSVRPAADETHNPQVACSLRTQQRAQTTHHPQPTFRTGKPDVLTDQATMNDQLIDVPP
jgi:hypothetical protein